MAVNGAGNGPGRAADDGAGGAAAAGNGRNARAAQSAYGAAAQRALLGFIHVGAGRGAAHYSQNQGC